MKTKILRAFRKNLRQLEQLVLAQLKEDTCCHGVSVAQCHCLLAVELLDRPSLNELAGELGLEKSTLSRTVEGLVKGGLLERVTDAGDRRVVRIGLTPQGQSTCDSINEANDILYGRVLEGMSRAPEDVVAAFAELVQAMSQARKTEGICLPTLCQEEKSNGV